MYKFAKKVANHEGFTLVELIVVIAILGILAGIAIPVYSGYIKKANQAADNVLLSAVNTAIGAARAENGFAKLGADAKLIVTSKKITGLNPGTVTLADSTDTLSAAIAASFVTYFGENANVELKYCTTDADFEFHTDTQTFFIVGGGDGSSTNGWTATSNGDGTTTYSNGSFEITVNDADVANVQASTFGTNMTPADLMSSVGGVVDAAAGVVNNPGIIASIINNMPGCSTLLEDLGITGDYNEHAEELPTALVVAVANQASTIDMDATLAQLNNEDFINGFASMTPQQLTQFAQGPGGMTNLALMYGMMTAYANSDTGSTVTVGDQSLQEYFNSASANFANATGGSNALSMLASMVQTMASSSGFNDYIANEGAADLQGFVSALNVIGQNGNTLLTDGGMLANGFTDNATLNALLAQILG